jgi:hypothetical protein
MATKAEIESIARVLAAKDNQIEELGSQLKEARRAADKTYNGWTNYATWRVNLEIFDGLVLTDLLPIADSEPKSYFSGAEFYSVVMDACKNYAEELIEQTSQEGLARDYAFAFLSEVAWRDIAKHLIATIEQEA